MKIRFDNFLLCVLWLLAMTLGTSFWFGTIYGFDIFSSAHWEYISYLQASQTPIKTSFYISVAIVIFMTIFGMYLILRPHMRKIRLPIVKTAPTSIKAPVQTTSPQTRDNTQDNDASTLDVLPGQMQPATTSPAPQRPTTPAGLSRPPRLVLPTLNGGYIHTPASPTLTGPTPTQNSDTDTLREIFTSAGYVVKPAPRVNGTQLALTAIGTGETLWLGATGIATTEMRKIMDKFYQIFSDTLDDASIGINGFVISAPDAPTAQFQDVLMFANMDELRQYMTNMQNPALPADDDGLFNAYSEYIDAVLNHIGKI